LITYAILRAFKHGARLCARRRLSFARAACPFRQIAARLDTPARHFEPSFRFLLVHLLHFMMMSFAAREFQRRRHARARMRQPRRCRNALRRDACRDLFMLLMMLPRLRRLRYGARRRRRWHVDFCFARCHGGAQRTRGTARRQSGAAGRSVMRRAAKSVRRYARASTRYARRSAKGHTRCYYHAISPTFHFRLLIFFALRFSMPD
jgi:hypothetical protein